MKKIPYREAVRMQSAMLESTRPALMAVAAELRERAAPTDVVAIVGIGASYYAAVSAVREFWKVGVRAFAVDAGQLWLDDLDIADVYIAISSSGESLETVALVERLRARGSRLLVSVTAERSGTLNSLVDVIVPCAQLEDSVPSTTGYTGTLQALAFIVSAWEDERATDALAADWASVPGTLNELLEVVASESAAVAGNLAHTAAIDFVGAGDAISSAAEGALLFREAPRLPCSWFDSRGYLHGPMESLEEGRGLVLIGDGGDDAVDRILRQARQIGCVTAHLTATEPTPTPPDEVIATIRVPPARGRLVRALYEMAALQLLAGSSAEVLSLTSGRFRYPQPQVKIVQAV